MSTRLLKLKELADARSGDKGSSANIGIIAHTPAIYDYLKGELTAKKVHAYFQPLGVTSSVRYELPNLLAFNFVCQGILDGGGSRSLRLDPQGKALGQILLEMEVDVPLPLIGVPTSELVTMSYLEKDIAVLTLKRSAKRNALNIALLEPLCRCLEAAYQTPALRVLIVAAQGPSFCAGMDLDEASDTSKMELSATLIASMLTMLSEAPFVTIAAAQGAAAGGGAGILSACDLVIAAADIQISYPEARRGLVPAQVAPLLQRLISRHHLHELLFAGEPILADRALSWGLVNKVVPPASLMDEAVSMAHLVRRSAPGAIQQTKCLLRELDKKSFRQDLLLTLPYHQQSRHSLEAKEGARAFAEKRPPSWMSLPPDSMIL